MNDRRLKALKGSIVKWDLIAQGLEATKGCTNCPLCIEAKVLTTGSCVDCVVGQKSGNGCVNTPYSRVVLTSGVLVPEQTLTLSQFQAIEDEIEFLISLLPTSEKPAYDLSNVELFTSKIDFSKLSYRQPILVYKVDKRLFVGHRMQDGEHLVDIVTTDGYLQSVVAHAISLPPKPPRFPKLLKGQPLWTQDNKDAPEWFLGHFIEFKPLSTSPICTSGIYSIVSWEHFALPSRADLRAWGYTETEAAMWQTAEPGEHWGRPVE